MRVPQHSTLIRQLLSGRLKQLASRSPILAASCCVVQVRCCRPSCRCQRGGPLHQARRLTYKDRGKTRSVHVPKDLAGDVRAWIAEHKRLKALLKEIHELSVALVRTHVRHRRRKAGRP